MNIERLTKMAEFLEQEVPKLQAEGKMEFDLGVWGYNKL